MNWEVKRNFKLIYGTQIELALRWRHSELSCRTVRNAIARTWVQDQSWCKAEFYAFPATIAVIRQLLQHINS